MKINEIFLKWKDRRLRITLQNGAAQQAKRVGLNMLCTGYRKKTTVTEADYCPVAAHKIKFLSKYLEMNKLTKKMSWLNETVY